MIGDEPTPKDNDPMTNEPLARARIAPAENPILNGSTAPGRPVEGRRINVLAWGLAGASGIALWVLIARLF